MSNTTFSGPVRSQNGFQSITVNANTGTVVLSQAATATATNALTFFPRYQVQGIRSATL